MGRKNKYETNVKPHLKDIPKWYEELTEKQIATKKLGVSVASWENYKKQYPELVECLNNSKEILIDELKRTIKKKAKGFYYTETKKVIREVNGEKTKYVEEHEKYAQPDLGAIHLLLKNLDKTWRNDDFETMELKRKRLELEKEKAEKDNW